MLDQILILAAANAAEGGEEIGALAKIVGEFGINPKILIAQIVNFCLVAFLLWKYAYGPVVKTIDERRRTIANGLKYAKTMEKKLAEAEHQHAETINRAKKLSQKILSDARESAKATIEKSGQEAIAKAEEIIKKAEAAAIQEREQMLEEVRKEIANLVVETTEKVLKKSLTTSDRTSFSKSAAEELTLLN